MAAPIVPSASALVTAAIDGIVSARPSTLASFNNPNSTYLNLPTAWRAQVLLLLARLGDEVKSARLKFATGPALRTLAASEFRTQLPQSPQTAKATVFMTRSGSNAGVIQAGTQFTKSGNANGIPLPIQAATYSLINPVYVAVNQPSAIFSLTANTPGSSGNMPNFIGYSNGGVIGPSTQPAFDPTFVAATNDLLVPLTTAGGGSSGLPDPVVVAAAKAYAVGQYGPTIGGAIAGLLAQQSVRHYAVFPASSRVPYGTIYIADESWADDYTWHNSVSQAIATDWTGFGCRARFGNVQNVQVAVVADFVLKSTSDLNYTAQIDANVRATATSYFDDRPDWYRWRNSSLQGLLTRADSRIKHCSSVSVLNAITGAKLVEPQNAQLTGPLVDTVFHYNLTQQNVTTGYSPPT